MVSIAIQRLLAFHRSITLLSQLRNYFSGEFRTLVLFVLGLAFCGMGVEQVYLRFVEHNWQKIRQEEEQSRARKLESEFLAYQRHSFEHAEQLASMPALAQALKAHEGVEKCFTILASQNRDDRSLELFDSLKNLVAWTGTLRSSIDTSDLLPSPVSFVDQRQIFSTFVVVAPIVRSAQDSSPSGYVVLQRLFDVNYPISNRFINNAVFATTFTAGFDVSVKFDFSLDAQPESTEQIYSVQFDGVNGKPVGYAYLNAPLLPARLDEIRSQAAKIINIFFLVLAIILVYGLDRAIRTAKSTLVALVARTILLWAVRYVLVWVDFPSAYVNWDVVDPAYFASTFGFGLAASVLDLFITALFLTVNMMWVVRVGLDWYDSALSSGDNLTRRDKIVGAAAAIIMPCVFFLALRGFAASIRSSVFDSTLSYGDPMFVLPSLVLSTMFLNLVLLACSLVAAGGLLFLVSVRSVRKLMADSTHPIVLTLLVAVLWFTASVIFGLVHPNPLTGQWDRLGYVAGTVAVVVLSMNGPSLRTRIPLLRLATVVVTAGVIFLIPLLDREAHQLDRTHVELVANEITRPSDSWLTIVVNRALDELSSEENAGLVKSGEPQELRQLAFTSWARSILSQEGFNCGVTFFDRGGNKVSEFQIGGKSSAGRESASRKTDSSRTVSIEEIPTSGGTVKSYVGFAPLIADGSRQGSVRVEVTADKQALLRGEAPEILRNYTKESFEAHHRTLVLSEFYQGKLVSTTGENARTGRPLPEEVAANAGSVWVEETVDGKEFESYYLRQGDNSAGDSWVTLSMEKLGLRWHLFSIVRLVMFYIVGFLLVVGIVLAAQRVRGKRVPVDFRTKLLAAFIVVSLIPLALVAYYNRTYAIERAEQSMTVRLGEECSVIVNALEKQLGMDTPFDVVRLTNEQCEEIASNLGSDFNVYRGSALLASSKPEVFFAELLSSQLPADAYLAMALEKRGFFVEHQNIGTLPYLVGYRPMTSEAGEIIGVVAVPSLYRQAEIDQDIMERNAFLFGAYALALILSVAIGTILANRISSPLRRLQLAARQLAMGDMNIELRSNRSDELGELEREFQRMTSDLKHAQDEMVRAQREMAWKEMAKQVAHEIKNPLTPMKLSIQHLRQAHDDKARNFGALLRKITDTLLEQVDALSRIASEFSRFARMPARTVATCDLHGILMEAINLFQQLPRISFRLRFDAASPTVNADREELRRAFINIIQNGVQAMEEKGEMAVMTKPRGRHVEVRVVDSGPGIPEDVRSRLFEPNFSTKSDGMGMGLAIVKRTVDEIGGTINISSSSGKGTTVTVMLPVASEDEV